MVSEEKYLFLMEMYKKLRISGRMKYCFITKLYKENLAFVHLKY